MTATLSARWMLYTEEGEFFSSTSYMARRTLDFAHFTDELTLDLCNDAFSSIVFK